MSKEKEHPLSISPIRKRILKELRSESREYVINGENGGIGLFQRLRCRPEIFLFDSDGKGKYLLNDKESVGSLINALSLEYNGTVATIRREGYVSVIEVTRISDRFVVEAYAKASPEQGKSRASFSQEETEEIKTALRAIFLHSTS